MQSSAATPCHLAHPTSFRAQLRHHFFWETILSRGKSCQPPPSRAQHSGCPPLLAGTSYPVPSFPLACDRPPGSELPEGFNRPVPH